MTLRERLDVLKDIVDWANVHDRLGHLIGRLSAKLKPRVGFLVEKKEKRKGQADGQGQIFLLPQRGPCSGPDS